MRKALSAALLLLASCTHSPPRDYYRERSMVDADVSASTYKMEKRELAPNPYGVRSSKATQETPEAHTGADARRALMDGNARFVADQTIHPHDGPGRRREIAGGQHPHTAVLSCSDSRVPPELVFDQGLGDLFVVRTAGEVADSAAIASLEYAVEHAGVKSLLILGHTGCGAVKATLSTPKGKSAGSKDLDRLVEAIRPHIKGFDLSTAGSDGELASRSQANGVVDDLLSRSKIIKEAVEKHGLELLAGIYHLDSGKVEIWPRSAHFSPSLLGK